MPRMYGVGSTLTMESLDAGPFLLAGRAMSGKYELLLDMAIEGLDAGDGVLFVTTNDGASTIMSDLEARYGELPDRFRLVDCISQHGNNDGGFDPERVEYVSSPGDLTGLGIGVSEQLQRFGGDDTDGIRVIFYSVSTLLMYEELESVFRFLHVLTGRIDSIDGLGIFAVDPTTHEESAVNTLKQLFDGVIEIRSNEDDREVRVIGVRGTSDEWISRE